MLFKDIIDRKIAINCRTEEEVKKLFEYAKENGLEDWRGWRWRKDTSWKRFEENVCYRFYLMDDSM